MAWKRLEKVLARLHFALKNFQSWMDECFSQRCPACKDINLVVRKSKILPMVTSMYIGMQDPPTGRQWAIENGMECLDCQHQFTVIW